MKITFFDPKEYEKVLDWSRDDSYGVDFSIKPSEGKGVKLVYNSLDGRKKQPEWCVEKSLTERGIVCFRID